MADTTITTEFLFELARNHTFVQSTSDFEYRRRLQPADRFKMLFNKAIELCTTSTPARPILHFSLIRHHILAEEMGMCVASAFRYFPKANSLTEYLKVWVSQNIDEKNSNTPHAKKVALQLISFDEEFGRGIGYSIQLRKAKQE